MQRRSFLVGSAAATALGTTAFAKGRRPKIAAITPIYHKYSHSQHIVDRFLEGYGWEGKHHRPAMDVVSLFVEQVGDNDWSRERLRRHKQLKGYPTIEEALTLGGDKLAVDGVLLIGEHGRFPYNKKGQKLYPRYQYFKKITDVYRKSGRTAPIFNDKHLSWKWKWSKEMYDIAQEMKFGFMAGSSLPVARRLPSIDLPYGTGVKEAVGLWAGGIDGGDIHVIEAMQAIIERRKGGETGIRSVEAFRGDRFMKAVGAGSWEKGGWDNQLMASAISRSNMLQLVRDDYGVVLPKVADIRRMAPRSHAYRFEYTDGTRATIIQFHGRRGDKKGGILGDCNIAARLDSGKVFSTNIYLPYYQMRNFFNPQVNHIETLFKTGKSPYPVERTLLTSGMTEAGIESLFQKQKKLPTPHLAVKYKSPQRSLFWRT